MKFKIKLMSMFAPDFLKEFFVPELYDNFEEMFDEIKIDFSTKVSCNGYHIASDFIIENERYKCLDCDNDKGCQTYQKMLNIQWVRNLGTVNPRKLRQDGLVEEMQYCFENGYDFDFSKLYRSAMYKTLIQNEEKKMHTQRKIRNKNETKNVKKFLTKFV